MRPVAERQLESVNINPVRNDEGSSFLKMSCWNLAFLNNVFGSILSQWELVDINGKLQKQLKLDNLTLNFHSLTSGRDFYSDCDSGEHRGTC